jgi:hypothetical protein
MAVLLDGCARRPVCPCVSVRACMRACVRACVPITAAHCGPAALALTYSCSWRSQVCTVSVGQCAKNVVGVGVGARACACGCLRLRVRMCARVWVWGPTKQRRCRGHLGAVLPARRLTATEAASLSVA